MDCGVGTNVGHVRAAKGLRTEGKYSLKLVGFKTEIEFNKCDLGQCSFGFLGLRETDLNKWDEVLGFVG